MSSSSASTLLRTLRAGAGVLPQDASLARSTQAAQATKAFQAPKKIRSSWVNQRVPPGPAGSEEASAPQSNHRKPQHRTQFLRLSCAHAHQTSAPARTAAPKLAFPATARGTKTKPARSTSSASRIGSRKRTRVWLPFRSYPSGARIAPRALRRTEDVVT
jgi:hypothetical protein